MSLSNDWVLRTGIDDSAWEDVTWAEELSLFCAVASFGTNRSMLSSDGINWTAYPIPSGGWRDVAWSGSLGLFSAVAFNAIITSPDGINWTTRTSPQSNDWRAITWSDDLSLFCASGGSGTNRMMTSPDGITWTDRIVPALQWRDVIWVSDLSLFVATAIDGTGNGVITSPDGITWTARTVPVNNGWESVVWSSSLSLLVAVSFNGTLDRVMTSPDGINWTSRTTPNDNSYHAVEWSQAAGIFVAVAYSGVGNRSMYSDDGINWIAKSTPADNQWWGVAWSPVVNLFVAVATSGTGDRAMTWDFSPPPIKTQMFSNNASTELSGAITDTATSITVIDGDLFNVSIADHYELATIINGSDIEIVKITSRSGNVLTVERAHEGTTAFSFSANSEFSGRITKETLDRFSQSGNGSIITIERSASIDLTSAGGPFDISLNGSMAINSISFIATSSSGVTGQAIVSAAGLISEQPTVNGQSTRWTLQHPITLSSISIILNTPAVGSSLTGFFVVEGFYI